MRAGKLGDVGHGCFGGALCCLDKMSIREIHALFMNTQLMIKNRQADTL